MGRGGESVHEVTDQEGERSVWRLSDFTLQKFVSTIFVKGRKVKVTC